MVSRALSDLRVGLELGHYRIVEKIGAGGMGVVYRARDEHLTRDVAIKVLPPGTLTDESARKHFHKEALILSQLNHPNVATIHDFDTQQGVDFLVMEYIPGITLSEKVAAGPLREKELLSLGMQLADGLAAAHEHGVVHRDLKPGNLRVTNDGRLKILDFGLAKLRLPVTPSARTESFSETHSMAGTLPYMAPEQLLGGEIDARTDIHATGSVLYEMATGQQPFAQVERSQLIGALLRKPPPPPTTLNPKLSPELERIIGKCLEKEPENRYQSARELAIDLRRLQTGVLSVAPPAARPANWLSARSVGSGLAVLASVIVLLFAFNAGRWRDRLLGRTGAPRIESLAVLPLANLSGDPQQDYFADGVTEELITTLGKLSALRVISRTSVMRYKNTNKPLPQIAEELNVDAVVEGSAQLDGNRARITAQLIQASTDRHLWAETYDRDMRDILAIESEVAQAIANEVRIKLTPQEQTRLASAWAVNPEAYEAYLRGRHFWALNQTGLEYFERATRLDPGFAPGYAGIALNYTVQGFSRPPREVFPKATEAAMKALQLDPELAEAHAALGYVKLNYEWDWAGAESEFRRAIELNPGSWDAHWLYAVYLTTMTRFDEAMSEAKQAQHLDPFSPVINDLLGWILMCERRYDDAIAQFKSTLELVPGYRQSHFWLGICFISKRMYPEARREFDALGLPTDDPSRGIIDWLTGNKKQALKAAESLKRRTQHEYVDAYSVAWYYSWLGDKDKAFAWLEKGFEERSANMPQMNMEPGFDPLRSDPRFQDLLRRMNLPQS